MAVALSQAILTLLAVFLIVGDNTAQMDSSFSLTSYDSIPPIALHTISIYTR